MTIRALLVGDDVLFREGLSQILRLDGRFRVVGEAVSGVAAVRGADRLKPDLIIVDLGVPETSEIDTIRHIRLSSSVPIGILIGLKADDLTRAALDAGASGYIYKDATVAELVEAAACLASGERLISLSSRGNAVHSTRDTPRVLASLTPRELEVLRALSSGASIGTIAARFGISRKTLRNHISSAYHKLRIYDRAQAVIVALREGLVEAPEPELPEVRSGWPER